MDQAIKSLAPLGTVASIGIAPLSECVPVNLWEHILKGKRYVSQQNIYVAVAELFESRRSVLSKEIAILSNWYLSVRPRFLGVTSKCYLLTPHYEVAELHANGRFPMDLLVKKYKFTQIAEAFEAMKGELLIFSAETSQSLSS